MLSYGLWIFGDMLLLLLFGMGVKRGLLSKYLVFYAYIGVLLLGEGLRTLAYFSAPFNYLPVYWLTQFLILAGSYFVLWEVFGQVLQEYPGAKVIARHLVTAIFVGVLLKVFVPLFLDDSLLVDGRLLVLERNLRAFQLALLCILQVLINHYGIPLGRNLRGLILGQGLFVATSLALLTARDFIGPSFGPFWAYGQQGCAIGTLLIWVHAFWHYEPNPKPVAGAALEEDYASLVRRTNFAFARARSSLTRILTP